MKTIKIPEEMLTAIHINFVAAHALARLASDQPEGVRGQDPTKIVEMMVKTAEEAFKAKPEDEQIRLLIKAGEKLAKLSGATRMKAEVREV
jgi:hypothetical protein